MSKIKIKIGISFWIFAFLCVYFGQGFLLINYMLVLFIHEYSHAYMAYKLGYLINNIQVIPFGISLNLKQDNLAPDDQIKIALAGPLSNIICVVMCLALWWIAPITYGYTYLFCFSSLITAIFNCLPCYPMDGGRVMYGILRLKKPQNTSIKWCRAINITISVLFLLLFVYSCFVVVNITFLLVAIFIFSSSFIKSNNNYNFLTYINKSSKNICYMRQIVVNQDTPIYKLCSYINNNTFVHFFVMGDGKILFSFFESDLDKIFINFAPSTKIGDISIIKR